MERFLLSKIPAILFRVLRERVGMRGTIAVAIVMAAYLFVNLLLEVPLTDIFPTLEDMWDDEFHKALSSPAFGMEIPQFGTDVLG